MDHVHCADTYFYNLFYRIEVTASCIIQVLKKNPDYNIFFTTNRSPYSCPYKSLSI